MQPPALIATAPSRQRLSTPMRTNGRRPRRGQATQTTERKALRSSRGDDPPETPFLSGPGDSARKARGGDPPRAVPGSSSRSVSCAGLRSLRSMLWSRGRGYDRMSQVRGAWWVLVGIGTGGVARPSSTSTRRRSDIVCRAGGARQGKARQGKARQGKARQGKARWGMGMGHGAAVVAGSRVLRDPKIACDGGCSGV